VLCARSSGRKLQLITPRRFVARINSRAQSAPRSDIYVRRTYSGRPSSSRQDFAAKHASTGVARRVRIYPYARAASPESRDRLARTAQREFRVLEGVDHPGILRALDFRETELGPALVFEHDPSAVRLDRFLAACLNSLSLDERLALLRQLAEAIAYAHRKRLHHRGLAPQNILVRDVEGDHPRLLVMNWLVASRGEGSALPTR
jgi:serine/threonine protein kinase